uniref:Uncharacterized protein n=1 Tax=Candidatus Methanogaster sp. ANME-2c ERB4 TaxID=2759911 RepID=A0A7G9YGD3_9EURY|nr:hypothetical protein NBCJMJBN_00028 [Methanosarcinales archaeon ANME-2c ERB4]
MSSAMIDARVLLLSILYLQDIGAAKPNAKTRCTSSVIKCGVW